MRLRTYYTCFNKNYEPTYSKQTEKYFYKYEETNGRRFKSWRAVVMFSEFILGPRLLLVMGTDP